MQFFGKWGWTPGYQGTLTPGERREGGKMLTGAGGVRVVLLPSSAPWKGAMGATLC